jgi:predicted RNase H-like nuclease (RuvC/YqgF family)
MSKDSVPSPSSSRSTSRSSLVIAAGATVVFFSLELAVNQLYLLGEWAPWLVVAMGVVTSAALWRVGLRSDARAKVIRGPVVLEPPDLGEEFTGLAADLNATAARLRELQARLDAQRAEAERLAAQARRQREEADRDTEIAEQQRRAAEAVQAMLQSEVGHAIRTWEQLTRRTRWLNVLAATVFGAVLGTATQTLVEHLW